MMQFFIATLSLFIALGSGSLIYPRRQLVPKQSTDNLQTFTGNLGVTAPPITASGDPQRPFKVAGASFVNFPAAAQRSCDIQFSGCANLANAGAGFSVAECQSQKGA